MLGHIFNIENTSNHINTKLAKIPFLSACNKPPRLHLQKRFSKPQPFAVFIYSTLYLCFLLSMYRATSLHFYRLALGCQKSIPWTGLLALYFLQVQKIVLFSTKITYILTSWSCPGGGGVLNFFQVGVCGPDFQSVGLANGHLLLKRGACERKISKFGGLWAENFQIWRLVSWKFPNLGLVS